jgi:hypothetical protein
VGGVALRGVLAGGATSLEDVDREHGGLCREEEAEVLVRGAEVVAALLEPGRGPLRRQVDVLRNGRARRTGGGRAW